MGWKVLLARNDVDPFTISGIDKSFYKLLRETYPNEERLFSYIKDNYLTHYYKADFSRVGKLAIKNLDNPEKIIALYKKANKILSQEIPDKNLLDLFLIFKEEFDMINDEFSIKPWWALEYWQGEFQKIINNLIKKNSLEEEQEKLFVSAHKTWKKTAIQELQEELRANKPIKELVEKYQFFRSWTNIWYRPITEQWIKEIGYPNKNELFSQKELIQKLQPNKTELEFLKLAPYIIFFKDFRDDFRRKQAYKWSFLFDKLAKKFNISREELGYYTIDEVKLFLENGFQTIERKGKELIMTIDKDYNIIIKDNSQNYNNIMLEVTENSKKQELKGVVANKGFAKGKAVIIESVHDLKKVCKGDVLVANTTHPNYLPAMSLSSAIVTNEGGLLSHAAIVSRELGIPCIVGTKNATSTIKNNDLIEVDANNNKVRKIR